MKQMVQTIKTGFLAVIFAIAVAAPVLSVASPVVSSAAAACDDRVLGIPPWYRGLVDTSSPECTMKSPTDSSIGGLSGFIWKLVLNIIEMVLVIIVYVAAGFIMYGGFLWLAGGARPDLVTKGRKTITNAAIGLVVSLGAIAMVNLIFGVIG